MIKKVILTLLNKLFGLQLTDASLDQIVSFIKIVGAYLPQVIDFVKMIINLFGGVAPAAMYMSRTARIVSTMDRAQAKVAFEQMEQTLTKA